MNAPLHILIVEDSPDDAQLMLLQLEQDGFEIEHRRADTEADFIAALDSPPDLILSDFSMPQFNGFRALQIIRERAMDVPFILVSGTIGEEVAVEAMKQGADDYLMKDRLGRLGSAIQSALNKKRLRDEKARTDIALRNSEARFRSLIENSSDEISIISAEGLLLYESPSSNPTLDYQPGDFIGKDLFQLLHPADLERVRGLFTQLVHNPDLHPRDQFRILHHDGTWHWVEAVGTNLLNEPAVGGIVVNYHDVTERVQAEEQIRYQALLLENVSDAVVSTDMKGTIMSWNKTAESMFGFTAEEVIGQFARHLIQAEYISTSQEEVRAQVRDTGSWNGEVLVFRKDGASVHSISSVSTIKDSQGNSLGYVSLNHDITDRKRAEEALRKSEEQYRSLFEDSPVSLWVEDFSEVKQRLDGLKENGVEDIPAYLREHPDFVLECAKLVRILDVNSASTKLYHAKHKSELLGSLYHVFSKLSSEEFEYELRQLADGQFNFEREESSQTLTGEPIYVTTRWSVAPGYEDSLAKLIISTTDITERKRAEEKIQRQIQKLSALRAIDIAISSTFDMKPSLAILLMKVTSQLDVTAAAVLLFDPPTHTLEYIAGNGFTFPMIEQTRLRMGEGLAGRAALERRPIHILDLTQADDFVRAELPVDEGFVSYYAVPLIAKGELKGVLEIFHRTELLLNAEWLEFLEALVGQAAIAIDNAQLFENLQRSKTELEHRVAERTAELHRMNIELESASRAKDEFLANMSHELRTPLNSIIGLSESLLEQIHGSLNEQQQRFLQMIASSGRHLLDLITDILDLSKIEAGKFDYHPQLVLVEDLCRSSLAFVNNQAIKKAITVTYKNETSISGLSADPRRLKQILINLLTNAVKFTPEHGYVTLQVQTNQEEDRIQFSVIDTGIGIAQDDMHRLFQPFVQLDSTLNRQHDGTGLGLTLVQKLTDLHGGSVEVESEVGKGSRFTIYLPLGEETTRHNNGTQQEGELSSNTPPEKDVASLATAHQPGKVLIAEDNAANILTIGDYLETHGYEIVVAHDGVEALEKAEAIGPDIILMDIQMPGMNGLEAMTRLRMNPRFASTPIIALTALAMPGDRERCLQAGATEYMSKPVSLKILVRTIVKLLNQQAKQYRSEEQ